MGKTWQAIGKPWASHGQAMASHGLPWQAIGKPWQAIGKPSASHRQAICKPICKPFADVLEEVTPSNFFLLAGIAHYCGVVV